MEQTISQLIARVAEDPALVLAPIVALVLSYLFFYQGFLGRIGNNNKFWRTVRSVLPYIDSHAREQGFYTSYSIEKKERVGSLKVQGLDAIQILYGKGYIDNPVAAHKTDWHGRKEIASLAHYGYSSSEIRSWGKVKKFFMMAFVVRYQTHVTLFKRGTDDIVVTAHYEYSPYNVFHAYQHFRGKGYDVKKGVERVAEDLDDVDTFVLGE